MEFRVIFSLQYSISINTFEVDPRSDSLHNALVKPKNTSVMKPAMATGHAMLINLHL